PDELRVPQEQRERAARDPPLRRGGRAALGAAHAAHARRVRRERPHCPMITRFLQWLATVVVATAGFVFGVNAAGATTYRTDVGKVEIGIRPSLPGNVVRVDVPQKHYSAQLHPFKAPIEWKARTLTLNKHGQSLARDHGPLALAQGVLAGRNAV